MKSAKVLFPTLLIFAAAAFFLFNLRGIFSHRQPEKPPFLRTYSTAPREYKPFVVIIPSYNNAKYCEKNIRSVLEQNYTQFRVIFIDDASTDTTFEKVQATIRALGEEKRVTLIKNPTNLGAAENYYRGIQSCQDDEIVVMVDGDDWIAHDQVLDWLNRCYNDPSVWMTYGSACEYPSYKRIESNRSIPYSVHEKHSYREFTKERFVLSHLKTAYAGLLKKIHPEDLQMNGRFLRATSDEAFMLPAVEMAGEHARFIRDILYIYNRQTPLNDDKMRFEMQQTCKNHILNLPSYSLIEDWKSSKERL